MKLFFAKFYLHGIFLICLFIIILLTFKQLPQTYFQQDEWLGLGQLMATGWSNITKNYTFIQLIFGEDRPLTRVVGTIFFELFGLKSFPLSVYSILFHFCNVCLVYTITYKVIKKKFFSFLGTLYFAAPDVAHQTVTWFGAAFGEQPASLFTFLSIYFSLLFVESKKTFYIFISLFFLLVSLYFKESGILLIFLYGLYPLIFKFHLSKEKFFKIFTPVGIFLALFAGYRLLELFLHQAPAAGSVSAPSSIALLVPTLLVRSIMYPLTSLSLSFMPYPIGINFLAEWMWKIYYPYITERPDLIFQTVILDLIAIVFSIVILVICTKIFHKKEYRATILFSLVLFFLNIIPYAIVSKTFSYLEPRYYYVPLLSSVILIAALFSYIFEFLKGKFKILFVFILIFYALFIRYNIFLIRSDIATQVDITNERESFVHQLYAYLPTLSTNVNIFYFTGNKSWLSERNFTPYQNGFGYTLMVLYYTSGKIPHYLPTTQFLWNFDDEGSRSLDDLTYAYFNSYTDLLAYIKKNPSDISYVHAFYYNRDTKKLSNITQETYKELMNDD